MKTRLIYQTVLVSTAVILLNGCIHKTHDTLHESVRYGNEKLAEFYIQRKGMDPNSLDPAGLTPLEYAVRDSDEDMAVMLLDSGADVNQKDAKGGTALMAAAAYNRLDTLELLLDDYEADPNIVRSDGMTALMFAQQYGHSEAEALLMEYRAKSTVEMNSSINAQLLLAAETGNVAGAQNLLGQGADVNARYYNTRTTPLIEAVMAGHAGMVTLLLNSGADANLSDANAKRASAYAKEQGESAILGLLPASEEK